MALVILPLIILPKQTYVQTKVPNQCQSLTPLNEHAEYLVYLGQVLVASSSSKGSDPRPSLRFWHTQSMDEDEGSDQN